MGYRRQAAHLVRRWPVLALIAQRLVGLFQPRFTAGVVGVLLDPTGERVLLVEHVLHARTPWGLPGGWMDRGEEPGATAAREIREETGLHARPVRPLAIALAPLMRRHLDMVFLCELDGSPPEPVTLSRELLDYRWCPFDDLPPLLDFHHAAIQAARESREKV